jgi:hypothetical protein
MITYVVFFACLFDRRIDWHYILKNQSTSELILRIPLDIKNFVILYIRGWILSIIDISFSNKTERERENCSRHMSIKKKFYFKQISISNIFICSWWVNKTWEMHDKYKYAMNKKKNIYVWRMRKIGEDTCRICI